MVYEKKDNLTKSNDDNHFVYNPSSNQHDEKSNNKNKQVVYVVNNPDNPKKEPDIKEKKSECNNNNTNDYLVVSLLGTLIFVVCAWTAQAQLAQIVQLSIPLVILFSLIVTYASKAGHTVVTYGLFIVVIIALYLIIPQYSFIITVALMAHMFIYCINKIQDNIHDYETTTLITQY